MDQMQTYMTEYLTPAFCTLNKIINNTFVFAPLFHELNSNI